ncbi:MAG: hypothetical protein ACYTEW_20705 [Planctomycetota bacterium]
MRTKFYMFEHRDTSPKAGAALPASVSTLGQFLDLAFEQKTSDPTMSLRAKRSNLKSVDAWLPATQEITAALRASMI